MLNSEFERRINYLDRDIEILDKKAKKLYKQIRLLELEIELKTKKSKVNEISDKKLLTLTIEGQSKDEKSKANF